MQLLGDIDALRAVRTALVAADAVVRLTQLRHATVIADKEGSTCGGEMGILLALRQVALVQAFVVVKQDRRNIQPVGAGHTIFAIVAGDSVELHHLCGRLLQECEVLLRERFQRGEIAQIVLQVPHAGHATQHGLHTGQAACETEGPRGNT